MRTFVTIILLFTLLGLYGQGNIKPVTGTWINFAFQDERNKYMNPPGVDNTSSELWSLKVRELSEAGMKYLVIMFVADGGKAYYPSVFMPHAYPEGKKSPVEAVLDAADAYDMKVFLSSGWAKSQDENPALPEIRAVQQKIMKEEAGLFSGRKSFFGWYLPCEDVVGPFLSQKAVDDANALAEEARRLTPGAKVLISPYGLRMARFDDDKFERQIAKLRVDIIAYQDEIGCVVEEMPLPHMKSNFARLREVHHKTGIQLWANIESFTWEKGLNVRPSALIPAPFPRYLSQLTGVSMAGVDEVVSFSICGIFDKPGSALPLGQPYYSQKAYSEYIEWANGKGRWPLLAASFCGALKHDAILKSVSFQSQPSAGFSKGKLTDGNLAGEDIADEGWLGFEKGDMIATIDMGDITPIRKIAVRFLSCRKREIFLPTAVEFLVSDDGRNFRSLETVQMEQYPNDRYDTWIDIAASDIPATKARYIRVYAINGFGKYILSDELLVNPLY
jgi:hypothetical protein